MNKGSRKGYRTRRTDLDCITSIFRVCGVQFHENGAVVGDFDDAESLKPLGRRAKLHVVGFETTALLFDARGAYVGREYMSRDECDYIVPRDRGASDGSTK